MVTCRECEMEVNQATEVCPHCGADLTVDPGMSGLKRRKPTLAKVLMRWAGILIVLLGCIWSFIWFVATPRTGNVTVEAETQAVQSLTDISAALSSYAQAQNGAYPDTLDALGDTVRQAAQLAQGEGYAIEYMPGPPGSDGAAHTYSLQARARNFGYRNYYDDPTGVIRATTEDREATSLDPPVQ